MRGEHRTELVVSSKHLNDTRWEDLLRELDSLQGCVWGVGRGFDDDGVAGQDGGDGLAEGQDDGEVPGADGADDAEGRVAGRDDLLVVLYSLFRQLDRGEVGHEGFDAHDFGRGELSLEKCVRQCCP